MTDKRKDDDEQITLTREELEAIRKGAADEATMDPAEKRLRQISRQEGKAGALEALQEFFSDLGEDELDDNAGGNVSLGDALRDLVGLKRK